MYSCLVYILLSFLRLMQTLGSSGTIGISLLSPFFFIFFFLPSSLCTRFSPPFCFYFVPVPSTLPTAVATYIL